MTGKMRQLRQNTEWCCVLMIMCLLLILVFRTLTLPAFGMEIEAMTQTEVSEKAGESADSCTIFIYMCGSNLESKYGLATEKDDQEYRELS